MTLKTTHWLKALVAAIVTGVSGAFLNAVGIDAAKLIGININSLDPKQLLGIAITGGLVGAAAYLKQSPVPPDDDPQLNGGVPKPPTP
jgi:hypothetical protein